MREYMAYPKTDSVFARIRLVPSKSNELFAQDQGSVDSDKFDNQEKPSSFTKTLTQSDANNGCDFSVLRYCAETIFPRLNYSADPPVQTTGWSMFVNQKKLVANNSIVFLRAENSGLCIGIRRAKRGLPEGSSESGWNHGCSGGASVFPYSGFSMFLKDEENKMRRNQGERN